MNAPRSSRPILAHEALGAGPPVLFIHGFLLARALWTSAATAVARHHHRAVLPDLRGHGATPPIDACSIADHADDCADLLDHLGIGEPAVVVGLSMGGIIAMEFFARYHTRVRAIALVDCRLAPETAAGRPVREAMARTALESGSLAAGGSLLDLAFAPEAPAALRDQWRAILERQPPMGIAAGARALADRPDHMPTAARVDVPTLVVCGEQDAITPVDLMRGIAQAIPDSRFRTIPDAGHLTPIEQPALFHRILLEFLGSL